jgi:sugar/nucleoside kinase (ribokinase family)
MMDAVEVIGLGSCTVDFFALVPRLIGAEEKMNVPKLEVYAGGVTANNLTQVARLGARSGWIGLLGDDGNGEIIRKQFLEDKMDVSGLEVVPGERSAFTWIPVDAKGDRLIYMFPNITARVTAGQIRNRFAPHIRAAKHFHTEASQLPLAPVTEAMRIAREAGVRVFFDLDVSPRDFVAAGLGTDAELERALTLTDVLKPCKAAAHEMTGEDDPARMAEKLLRHGPSLVTITMGGDGCLVASKDGVAQCPGFSVKVVDTTGAGDGFLGGLSYALLKGQAPKDAGRFANACAALCCTRVGARAMSPLSEVESLLSS